MSDAEIKRAVDGWRRANPWAVDHGQKLEHAYTRAVRNPSYEFSAGRVTYLFDGQHLWYALPSGRILCYPYAKLEPDGLSYAKAAFKPAADATEWPRARLWRGLACENITQATANDILRYALRELDRRELGTVLHVHDEIVVECREEDAQSVQQTMTDIMCTAPDWASNLPLNIEINVMHRYGKG
jgi:DNA polymerase